MTASPSPPPADQVEAAQVLAACPFCNGKADTHTLETESLWSHNVVEWLSIGCEGCNYTMCSEAQDELRAKWNRRPVTSVAPEGMREAPPRFVYSNIEAGDMDYTVAEFGFNREEDAEAFRRWATAALAALPPASGSDHGPVGWRPIADAPRDGTDFLALVPYQRKHHQMVGCIAPDGNFRSWPGRNRYDPSAWQPLQPAGDK